MVHPLLRGPFVLALLVAVLATLPAPAAVAADGFKAMFRVGMASSHYQLSTNGGTTSSTIIGNAYDLILNNSSSIGIDIALGLSFSEKLFKSSQLSLVYKFFPFTFPGETVAGDAETKIVIESAYYPYIGAGFGYSTLIVKTDNLLSANAQYFHGVVILGADIPVWRKWLANLQLGASYGSAGTGAVSISATGYSATLGATITF